MADLTLNISQYDPLKQFTVRPWETFSPDDQLAITDKINLIVQTLNRLGKLSNDVVTDWNKVMTWVSNDGMTTEVDSQLQKWKDDGTLVALLNAFSNIGDLTTLQTIAKDSIVHAINENVTNLGIKANQNDLVATNQNVTSNTNAIALKANQTDLNSQKSRIDSLVSTPNSSFYQKSTNGTTGALLVVSSGATTGQINLASVTPVATGYTPVAGDYVLLVYGVSSGSSELIDGRTGANNVVYTNIGTAIRSQISQLQSQLSFKQNILPITYTSGGYWNKDVNNNLNLVANSTYSCINSINVKAGTTYVTGVVMGYYSWLKSTVDGTVTRLDNTVGTQETTYSFTPTVDSTLWLSANNGKLPYVMVIQNATALPTTYKKPNVIYDVYVEDRLIDNIDKISSVTKDVLSGATSSNIQNATLTTGYYWNFVTPNMTKVAYASYNTLEAIELKAGTPYAIGKVFGRWSWVYDKVNKTASYLDSVDEYLNYTITPTNDSLLYLTCNTATPQVFKNTYEMPNDSFGLGVSINNQIDGINKRFVVGTGLQYTSLTQAIADAVKYPHSIVEVKGGTYDLYQEQGGDSYFSTFAYSDSNPTFCGIVLKNDVHVIFSSDSKVVFNYTGTNVAVMQYYSPFNAAVGIGGFTLENLNLVASKCRYGVHDERGYTLGRYKNTYLNCKISLDNSLNTAWNNYQCIGGGLGISGYIEIDGCQFTSVISTPTNIVSYHNNGDTTPSKSNVYIKNSWFSSNGYARIGYYGTSTDLSEMVVTGCSYNHIPTMSAEGSATLVNVKLTMYSNELRTS